MSRAFDERVATLEATLEGYKDQLVEALDQEVERLNQLVEAHNQLVEQVHEMHNAVLATSGIVRLLASATGLDEGRRA